MDINPSLPKMPPVLVGKLDEATWKTVLRAMGNTGSMSPELFLNICSRLTCTVRPACSYCCRPGCCAHASLAASPTQCCCIMPCAMASAAADHEAKVAAFIAEFENDEALKKAGVSIKRCSAEIIDAQGNKLSDIIYIRFEVAPQGAPTTVSPAAQQDMA
jgi:hypothetical protein